MLYASNLNSKNVGNDKAHAPRARDGANGDGVIDRLITVTMAMLDMYLPAVLSVIYGNELPKDAIRCVEGDRCGGGETESDADEAAD